MAKNPMSLQRHRRSVLAACLTAHMAGALLSVEASTTQTQPSQLPSGGGTWSSDHVLIKLAPGEAGFRHVFITTGLSGELRIGADDALLPYLSAAPLKTAALAGQPTRLDLVFRVRPGKPVGVHEGRLWASLNGVRLSTSVRVTLQVVPDLLPPSPGPAGDATLEGIDSDGDGVRDDLELYVAHAIPAHVVPQARRYVAAVQERLLGVLDPVRTRDAILRSLWAFECVAQAANADGPTRRRVRGSLLARVLNTLPRSRAYLLGEQHASGMLISESIYMTQACQP